MSRSVIPPGKAGLIVLAAAVVPIVLKKMKPVTRAVGKGLANMGEMLVKSAEEPQDEVKKETAAPPKSASAKRPRPSQRKTQTRKPKADDPK